MSQWIHLPRRPQQSTTDWLASTTEIYFLAVLEVELKVSAALGSSEGSLLGLQMAIFMFTRQFSLSACLCPDFPFFIRTAVIVD